MSTSRGVPPEPGSGPIRSRVSPVTAVRGLSGAPAGMVGGADGTSPPHETEETAWACCNGSRTVWSRPCPAPSRRRSAAPSTGQARPPALQREIEDNSAQILSATAGSCRTRSASRPLPVDYERLQPYSQSLHSESSPTCSASTPRSERYVFAGPVPIDFSQGDDLGRRPLPGPQPRHRAGGAAAPAQGRRPAVALDRRRGNATTALPARPRRRSGLQGRPPHQRPRGQPPACQPPRERRHPRSLQRYSTSVDNGTLVDGRPGSGNRLFDGTTVRIGNTDIVVQADPRGALIRRCRARP